MNDDAIREDERRRLSALIEAHADEIGAYAADTVAAVRLVALLIGLKPGGAAVTQLEEARRANDLNAANLAGFHAALAVAVSERDEAREALCDLPTDLVDHASFCPALRVGAGTCQCGYDAWMTQRAAALSQLPTQQEAE